MTNVSEFILLLILLKGGEIIASNQLITPELVQQMSRCENCRSVVPLCILLQHGSAQREPSLFS